MTRKKFIQLAMSKGYCKNIATELAKMVIESKHSYYEGFLITLKCLKPMELQQ